MGKDLKEEQIKKHTNKQESESSVWFKCSIIFGVVFLAGLIAVTAFLTFKEERNSNSQNKKPAGTKTQQKVATDRDEENQGLTEISFTGKDYNYSLGSWNTYRGSELGIKFNYPGRYKETTQSVPSEPTHSHGLLGRMDTKEKMEKLLKIKRFKGNNEFESSGLVSGKNQIIYKVYDYKFGSNEFSEADGKDGGEIISLGMDSIRINESDANKQNGLKYYLGRPFGDPNCFSASIYIPRKQKTGVMHIQECRNGESPFRYLPTENMIKRYIEAKYLSTLERIQ